MKKVKSIIEGLYGISESEKMMPKENARFILKKTVECLEKALEENNNEIYNKAIDDFVKLLREDTVVEDDFGEIRPMNYDELASLLKTDTKIIGNDVSSKLIKDVSENISCNIYRNNLVATKELMDLINKIVDRFNHKYDLTSLDGYISFYDDYLYSYNSWEELINSEKEQGESGLTEQQCKDKMEKDKTIWLLPCGIYVWYEY